ncbi:hypothetical protein COCCADRAFT_106074 [Bipolaris zeicola 26-R-13]|uniref:Uncharacterized protein n=1 Tax=Cochliobolus carbonum (strain 26-R-13) TaxID=930089 RepID=W6XWL0_COCC2|nr:uncharacterized protein COCCADRAFT_106074 [Bipolaris zeicola 26-R-13]EUC29605.1 hypothetical protein COCCADRAFT_106074 [Bipolaris zeicola 26-R-13]
MTILQLQHGANVLLWNHVKIKRSAVVLTNLQMETSLRRLFLAEPRGHCWGH